MITNAFCELLEYKINNAFRNSTDERIKSYWCDGILLPTFENEYSQKYVNDNRRITLTAFIGVDGQVKHELILLFGRCALSKYAKGLEISDCIPDFETMSGFEFDSVKKQLLIELL